MTQAMSYQERQAASAALQQKISDLCSYISANNITEPDKSVVDKFLDSKDLATVWKKLEREGGSKPTSVKEAWEGLVGFGKEKAKNRKWTTLMHYFQGTDWESHLMSAVDEISIEKARTKVGDLKDRGELDRAHGKKKLRSSSTRGFSSWWNHNM